MISQFSVHCVSKILEGKEVYVAKREKIGWGGEVENS